MQGLRADISEVCDHDQTFINDQLLGSGLIFQILMDNLSAVKCIDRGKIYLKSERIFPSEDGLMLIADDASLILIPQLLSDQYGCYVQSSCLSSLSSCLNCGFVFSMDCTHVCCPRCSE